MTDEHTHYDDNRLLALALGLDDDPELLAAAEHDAELAARLETMRAEIAAIGAQVNAAIPAPDESYADLATERWSGVRELLEAPPRTARTRRGRRWWRIVAPVTALAVLALAVGIVAVYQGGSMSSMSGSAAEVGRAADDAQPPLAKQTDLGAAGSSAPSQADQAAPNGGTTGGEDAASGEAGGGAAGSSATTGSTANSSGGAGGDSATAASTQRLADQLDRFAVVVLARAREATGILQRFAVVRLFKGNVPDVIQLAVGNQPADPGRLHLLMLNPISINDDRSAPAELAPASAIPGHEEYGRPLHVTYTYHGKATAVRELALGTDPNSITLPPP